MLREQQDKGERLSKEWRNVAKVSADFGEAVLNESPGVFFYNTLWTTLVESQKNVTNELWIRV